MAANDVFAIVDRKLTGSRYDAAQITDAIAEAEYMIRNFCGRWQYVLNDLGKSVVEDLPPQIDYIWASMTTDILSLGYQSSQTAAVMPADYNGIVKTIKEGDTTIEFTGALASDSGISSSKQIINNYAADLYPFRRLYAAVKEV